MELLNTTPFPAERVVLQDKEGRDLLVVIVKCTYSLQDPASLEPAEKQVPIQMADEYHGEAGTSSVRYESDMVPWKTGTDVVLLGHAYAPKRWATEVDVFLRVGPLRQTARVFGDRRWKSLFGFKRISSPEPLGRMPLVYERAFGGKDTSSPDAAHHDCEFRNPVGCGFRAKKSSLAVDAALLPNIEDPAALIGDLHDRPAPVGFGFIGRHWQPRAGYAGTYDQAWKETRSPLMPADFDERYFNGAHPRLVSKGFLQGNEFVEMSGVSPSGPSRFSLPRGRPTVQVTTDAGEAPLEMRFDTLVLEPDEQRAVMVWRGTQNMHNNLHKVKRIAAGFEAAPKVS